jgi:hypothetical protein
MRNIHAELKAVESRPLSDRLSTLTLISTGLYSSPVGATVPVVSELVPGVEVLSESVLLAQDVHAKIISIESMIASSLSFS